MIQLTNASEYALRGMQYLAGKPAGTICMLGEISTAQAVPVSFLGKIFQALARAGLVTSHRGASGGFSLAQPARDISLLSVIEAVEGKIALFDCVLDDACCPDAQRIDCSIRPMLQEAVHALREVFDRYTVAQLSETPSPIPAPLGDFVSN